MVHRMVRQGLLQRRRSRLDRRAYEISLTDEGSKLLAAADPVARKVDTRLLRALPPERREPFLEALRAIAHALDER
jgi:DNA-binding MarR family transcriptional regulator